MALSALEKRLVRRNCRGSAIATTPVSWYRSMWLVVAFDLPVGTKKERRQATQFRKRLLEEGFFMKQWSVYLRYFENRNRAEVAAERIGALVPPMGTVSILFLTDKQYGLTRNYTGKTQQSAEEKPAQLALF